MLQTNRLKEYQNDFLLRIAELTESGFTQYEAVDFLFSQYDKVKQSIKLECLNDMKEGRQLSEILTKLNYPVTITLQIYFSEQYGEINQTLLQCHQFSMAKKESTNRLIKSVQYPLILIVIFFILIIIVNQTVLPQFKTMYESMGVDVSPELTFMTNLLYTLPNLLIAFIAIFILLIIGYYGVFKYASIHQKLWLITKVPVVNSLYRKYITYRVSLELSFFLANGISMIKIIDIFKEQNKDEVIQHIGEQIKNELLKGMPLAKAVETVALFEPSMLGFIEHGEKNSKLDVELKYYADYIFKKLETQILTYIKWIQPIVFAALGLLIITLYLVIILPMLQMMSGIQ